MFNNYHHYTTQYSDFYASTLGCRIVWKHTQCKPVGGNGCTTVGVRLPHVMWHKMRYNDDGKLFLSLHLLQRRDYWIASIWSRRCNSIETVRSRNHAAYCSDIQRIGMRASPNVYHSWIRLNRGLHNDCTRRVCISYFRAAFGLQTLVRRVHTTDEFHCSMFTDGRNRISFVMNV